MCDDRVEDSRRESTRHTVGLSPKSPGKQKMQPTSAKYPPLNERAALMKTPPVTDLILHTRTIKARMRDLVEHLRKDVGKVKEPKAQALF